MKSRNGFKSAITVIFALFTIIGLTGCNLSETEAVTVNTDWLGEYDLRSDRLKVIEENYIYTITDDKTGVQYIIYSETFYRGGAGGITVRYNADGTPYIDPEWNGEADEDR